MKWLDFLATEQTMLDDYLEHLGRLRVRYEADQDRAKTWEEAQKALGVKLFLDARIAEVKRSQTEAESYARYVRNS